MNNVALITGASNGIGRDLALEHSKHGDLIIVARTEGKLIELKNEIETKFNRKVLVIAKDLSKRNAPKEIYDQLKNENIQIDYLINNAGFGGYGKFHERNWDDDQSMIDLNINSLAYLTRLFLPDMLSRNKGRILNVASTAGFMPGPMQAVYFATKSFVLSFSQAIAEELHDTNITVTALCPGPVDTGFVTAANLEGAKLFKNNLENSKDVAKKGYKAMLKGKLIKITQTQLSIVINLFLPLFPRKSLLKITRKMQEKTSH